jgi:hypothetical protein
VIATAYSRRETFGAYRGYGGAGAGGGKRERRNVFYIFLIKEQASPFRKLLWFRKKRRPEMNFHCSRRGSRFAFWHGENPDG